MYCFVLIAFTVMLLVWGFSCYREESDLCLMVRYNLYVCVGVVIFNIIIPNYPVLYIP